MGRLIDENEAIEQIDEWLDSVGTVFLGHGLSYYWELLGCLKDCKTIDPLKHGRWMTSSERSDTLICSVCGAGFDMWKHEEKDFHFCPNCGAKMDRDDVCMAGDALRAQRKVKSPCAVCGYGGKHLDAPPCTSCPAHPKEAEKNEPLTIEDLRKMAGKPYYHVSLRCEGLNRWGILPAEVAEDPGKCNYGKWWLAYRRPPKELKHDD